MRWGDAAHSMRVFCAIRTRRTAPSAFCIKYPHSALHRLNVTNFKTVHYLFYKTGLSPTAVKSERGVDDQRKLY